MKFSFYNIVIERDDSLILYNSLRSSYVKINKGSDYDKFLELQKTEKLDKNDSMVQALYQRGYVVDYNLDEYTVAKDFVKSYYKNLEKSLYVMIYVTEQCNFRCIYCPEKHVSKSLSIEKWDALYLHIEKGIESGKYNEVKLAFFGGEPLLELKNILYFLKKLKKISEKYPEVLMKHEITTNAYMLTSGVYDELVGLNVKKYQITVDGFAETHNKMRPRVDGEGTWDVITDNLKYIETKDDDAEIILRTNYNDINEKSMNDFYDWLQVNFVSKKFTFLFHPVSKFNDNVEDDLLADKNSKISAEIRERLVSEGKDDSFAAENILSSLSLACKCVKPSYYTYTTDGNITKCEQDYEKRGVIGYINNNGEIVYTEKADKWLNNQELENCKFCQLYPLCAAKACPVKHPSQYCDTIQENFEEMIVNQIAKGYILH